MILVKVYGAFHPAGAECREAVARAGAGAAGHGEPWLFLEGDMLRFAFEGLYFPLEDVLEALRETLAKNAEGRLDYLDLDDWSLTRHVRAAGGEFAVFRRGLDHVLAHSGH